jgi:hypothetical protein|tara:strand:+ start:63 stop:623 length:561 start_codon:yes stop_codon:yes gene_type:complete
MFKEYLTEAKKEYKFSIGLAGEMPEGFADELEECLKRYSVNSMSAGKRTPIQERPLDFPQLSNCEVTYFEVSLAYPTTPQVLEEYISQCCACERSNIIVRTENDPRIDYQQTKEEDPYETKLEKEDMGQADPKAQEQVGGERVMGLLKELETARKEKENDPIADVKPGDSKDISDNVGTTSPIGSK